MTQKRQGRFGRVGRILRDKINSVVPVEEMCESAKKLRDIYAIKPGAPFVKREFGYYCLERWYEQGLDREADLSEVFDYDPCGNVALSGLGCCEAEFFPEFEEKHIEDRGEHEVIQDHAGRHLLVFKGRRQGFMPEYIDHPVKDMNTWRENVKWRMDPSTSERYEKLNPALEKAKSGTAEGKMVSQDLIGGYMYLRSLMGPEDLLYAFYDKPDVIDDCMKSWFALADAITAYHQKQVTFDELFLEEDICYNHGLLVSPDTVKKFLFPYYQQLIANIKSRQLDKSRRLYIQVDTDGFAIPAIDLYRDNVGLDVMSPFEVASGCDVVEIAKQYPDLVMTGGIDKRVLAESKDAIDKHLEYILPAMRKRGGYIPTCDHGVPEEVTLENYMHYRKRCVEFGS